MVSPAVLSDHGIRSDARREDFNPNDSPRRAAGLPLFLARIQLHHSIASLALQGAGRVRWGEAARCTSPQSPSPVRGEGWGEGRVRDGAVYFSLFRRPKRHNP